MTKVQGDGGGKAKSKGKSDGKHGGDTEGGYTYAIHPSSKWLEPAREDEISMFEVFRTPRKIENLDRRIRASLELLNTEFRCAICLGYLKDTTAVRNCLHRFCGECIHKCVRMGLKECPSCRKPIASRRALKADTKFDAIVKHVLGSDAIEEESTESLQSQQDALKMVHLQRAIQRKRSLLDQQRKNGGHASKKAKSPKPAPVEEAPIVMRPERTVLKTSPLIEIELRRHPTETKVDALDKAFLTLRADCKVSFLRKFLAKKLVDCDYQIVSTIDDNVYVLHDEMSMLQAQDIVRQEGATVLKYRCISPRTNFMADTDAEPCEERAGMTVAAATYMDSATAGGHEDVGMVQRSLSPPQNEIPVLQSLEAELETAFSFRTRPRAASTQKRDASR